ncbi:hypothetical protein M2447_002224 [Ereboglobus sp. PH5-10]|uniref:hypothetical protein n=1 Tax=Ereboglobus sp. PH5-10 TaxID=2940629 RepID=UPI002404F470|nr:hypothetical protein [Ereboglobus sp. PH5-10]MDF9828111.1 hypothetical protein [Ereboglobus sp. PH5-10]
MKFQYTPTFADYRMLNKWHLSKIRELKILRLLAILLFLYYCASPILRPSHPNDTTLDIYLSNWLLLLLPLLIFSLFFSSFFLVRKKWNTLAEIRCEKSYEISENDIHVTGAGFEGRLEWQHIASAEYHKGWFFLMTNQRTYYFFPASIVPNTNTLIALLSQKVAKTKGFPK